MDHSGMGHGDMGHGDMGGEMPMCNMNMLFTWDTTNLCIVFKWWHIRSTGGLLFSLLAVVALTAAYEAIRSASRRYEQYVTKKAEGIPSKPFIPSFNTQYPTLHGPPNPYILHKQTFSFMSIYG